MERSTIVSIEDDRRLQDKTFIVDHSVITIHYYFHLSFNENRKKTAVYHTVKGDPALLHTSKTAK